MATRAISIMHEVNANNHRLIVVTETGTKASAWESLSVVGEFMGYRFSTRADLPAVFTVREWEHAVI